MPLDLTTTVTLNNGVAMPLLGLGVYQAADGGECREAVVHALKFGYRHVDTAAMYGNEKDVGEGVRASGVPRDQVFVTTKLWNSDHGYDRAMRAFDASMKRLRFETLDQYLIHWPVQNLRGETWRALVKLYQDGRIRSIGVSNYTVRHLEELLSESDIVPATNQVEFHPFLFQRELMEFCKSKGIQLVAYSPLTKGTRLRDPALASFAKRYERTPAQIMIRWCLQHGVVCIPKSSHPGRIEENASVYDFEISPEDMAALDALNENDHCTWDPTDAP
ncbi:MAG: aldo/keto reductase [Deltaproteobacteria bacterium]|nr:aldo/keto reductase [Deltaproteobacteria bacterium]